MIPVAIPFAWSNRTHFTRSAAAQATFPPTTHNAQGDLS